MSANLYNVVGKLVAIKFGKNGWMKILVYRKV